MKNNEIMMENYLKNRIEEQIHINKGTAEIYLAIRQWMEARLTVRLLPQSEFIQPGTISRITKFDGIQSCLYITHNKIQVYVTLELLQIAGISQDEAWEMAHKNVAESCEILTIKDILSRQFPEMYDTEVAVSSLEVGMFEMEMYVLSNESATYGVAGILNDEILRDFGERIDCRQLIAIPCSVHEIILMRRSEAGDDERMREVIRDINHSKVAPEERLGDFPYLITIGPDEVQVSALKG